MCMHSQNYIHIGSGVSFLLMCMREFVHSKLTRLFCFFFGSSMVAHGNHPSSVEKNRILITKRTSEYETHFWVRYAIFCRKKTRLVACECVLPVHCDTVAVRVSQPTEINGWNGYPYCMHSFAFRLRCVLRSEFLLQTMDDGLFASVIFATILLINYVRSIFGK